MKLKIRELAVLLAALYSRGAVLDNLRVKGTAADDAIHEYSREIAELSALASKLAAHKAELEAAFFRRPSL